MHLLTLALVPIIAKVQTINVGWLVALLHVLVSSFKNWTHMRARAVCCTSYYSGDTTGRFFCQLMMLLQ